MGTILVGTASWTDKTLIACGKFYPRGCSSAEGRLRYYADHFPIVEVDSSYYALPSVANAGLWIARTPDDFRFNIKAFRLFTGHQTPAAALPRDIQSALASHFAASAVLYYRDTPREIRDELWRRYEQAIAVLHNGKRLGAVLFQFAPWVKASRSACDHILECRERLARYMLAVEFRHRSWFDAGRREATLAFEREHRLVNVTVDEPQGPSNSIPAVWDTTHPQLAILRLHGRNLATWNLREATVASDRFNYDYSEQELEAFLPSLNDLAAQVFQVHVIFNNNYEDQGQRNAGTLMRLVGGVHRKIRVDDDARDAPS
ncbi:DUF72 domain-containing protein [Tahibacter amnicola]|uniref:DUF72 domain-containing protein n=1 Tax=Tahibacter amnicola TaxID=2976241 RepID=A0ABY6BDL9_9GAMM|nr:DUF72 domain-containing protein [Tahibacter amnicola]UXI67907.1 DUF72 domain-containing protein [Tahibacter amnicola]